MQCKYKDTLCVMLSVFLYLQVLVNTLFRSVDMPFPQLYCGVCMVWRLNL